MASSDSFKVVVNHEEQYTLWPADRFAPRGWKEVGKRGTREQCLTYIEEVWTDMRAPLVRRSVLDLESRLRREAGL